MTTAALSLPLVGAWPRVCSRETMRLLLTGDDAISPRWALFVARLFCPMVCPMASVPVAFPDDVARAQAAVSSRGTAGHLMVELLPRVRNLVRYLVRGDAMVDDLAQEAIVAILRGLPGYRGDAPLLAWVDRVVVRSTFERRRRERQRTTREGAELPTDGNALLRQSAPELSLDRRALMSALEKLKPPQRDAIVMHHVVGMSIPEIAASSEAPAETVRSRLRLGMIELRALLFVRAEGSSFEELAP